jgi:hypothetical protein
MGFFDEMANTYIKAREMRDKIDLENSEKRSESITSLFKSLTSGVNEINDQLVIIYNSAQENDFLWYEEFKIFETFDVINSKYDDFWKQADAAREVYLSNHDIEQFKNAIDLRIHPIALNYLESAQALIRNIPDVAYMCLMDKKIGDRLEKVNEYLDFEYSEFSEIDFDPAILHDLKAKIFDCYDRIFGLGQALIRDWKPFREEAIIGWKESYDLALKEFNDHEKKIVDQSSKAKAMLVKLWEIRKQVELTSRASSNTLTDSPFDRIEKLGALMEKGLITISEFEEKKAQILKEI